MIVALPNYNSKRVKDWRKQRDKQLARNEIKDFQRRWRTNLEKKDFERRRRTNSERKDFERK